MKKEFKSCLIIELKEVHAKTSEAFADIEAEKVVQTHLDALLYEPTNKDGQEKTYLGGEAPKELPRYCEEFAASGPIINPGPAILTCNSVGGKAHNFLTACGHGKCAKYNHVVSTYYHTTSVVDTGTYCLLCSATKSLVPQIGTEAAQ